MKLLRVAASVAFSGLIAQGTSAATLSGNIAGDDGKAIAGAMVTLNDEKRGIAESVFSDAKGAFQITTSLAGDLSLRIRKFYFADLSRPLSLSSDTTLKGNFTLNRLVSAEAISDQLPAAYHFSQIAFEPGTLFSRENFQKDCLTCHQLGNAFTRWPRSVDDWKIITRRMNAKLGNTDEAVATKRAEMLAAAFDGKPISVRPVFPYDPALAHAKIVEYRLDKAVGPHDAAVGPDDNLVYIADGGAGMMEVTDLKAGTTDYIPTPPAPNSSSESAQSKNGPAENEGRLGLHSLAYGKDGRWYVTESAVDQIGVFNPKTRTWEKSFEIPGKTRDPHTIRVDKEGMVWFTIAITDQVGRLDPTTGNVTVLTVPKTPSEGRINHGEGPYGIAVNPKDGSVWYFTLGSERIGRIDPKTFEVKQWPSPVKGSRRGIFDASGHLWLTGYSKGEIARITPDGANGFKSEVIEMPEFAKGDRPAPYSLGVNPKSGDIWVNETVTDHTYRYIPGKKQWIAYPMPLRGTYTRDLTFTREGYVCMSNHPIPLAALEGGVTELICIHPEGDVKVEAAAD